MQRRFRNITILICKCKILVPVCYLLKLKNLVLKSLVILNQNLKLLPWSNMSCLSVNKPWQMFNNHINNKRNEKIRTINPLMQKKHRTPASRLHICVAGIRQMCHDALARRPAIIHSIWRSFIWNGALNLNNCLVKTKILFLCFCNTTANIGHLSH